MFGISSIANLLRYVLYVGRSKHKVSGIMWVYVTAFIKVAPLLSIPQVIKDRHFSIQIDKARKKGIEE